MKPSLVCLSPCSFPNGGAIWNFYLSKVLNESLYLFVTHEGCDVGGLLPHGQLAEPRIQADYSIIGGAPDSNFNLAHKFIKDLPKPIIVMLHDVGDMSERHREFWNYYQDCIDGFLCSKEETFYNRPKWVKEKPHLRISHPFIADEVDIYNILDNKINQALFAGRIVPDKGARVIASIGDYTDKVKIVLAGQKVDYVDYKSYYEGLKQIGATIVPSPVIEELKFLMNESKFYAGFTMQMDGGVGVEYAALEAMNRGCYPLIPTWCSKYYDKDELFYTPIESAVDAAKKIEYLLEHPNRLKAMQLYNYEKVMHWSHTFKERLENFVSELK